MAQIIRVNGTVEPLEIPAPTSSQLATLQQVVGGYIEIVYLDDGRLMVLDDEGKLKAKRVNLEATRLYGRGTIVGDVVVAEKGEID